MDKIIQQSIDTLEIMQNLLISIIIPIYNTEKYLPKCLDSIIAQTYANWEAIIVDDGSPDNCRIICDEYATKDKRFKVIHQQNGGVSVARQTGLDNATGDYVIHCDPDDWIEPTMLKEMLDCAISNNADIVICDLVIHKGKTIEHCTQNIPNNITSKELQNKIIEQKVHGSLCNKLVKRESCKDICFTPKDVSFCEDELFLIKTLNKELTIRYIHSGLYHYILHNGSVSMPTKKSVYSKLAVLNEIENFIDGDTVDNFRAFKKNILVTAFLAKEFQLLKALFQDLQSDFIKEGKPYNIKLPLSSCFSIALSGHPYIAYHLYKFNVSAIRLILRFKNKH